MSSALVRRARKVRCVGSDWIGIVWEFESKLMEEHLAAKIPHPNISGDGWLASDEDLSFGLEEDYEHSILRNVFRVSLTSAPPEPQPSFRPVAPAYSPCYREP